MSMKKIIFLLIAISAIIFTSCKKDEDPVYKLTVTVNFPDTYNSTVAEGAWVFATETGSGRTDSAQTDASGVAVVSSLIEGVYNVSASTSLTEAEAEAETGVAQVIVLSGVE